MTRILVTVLFLGCLFGEMPAQSKPPSFEAYPVTPRFKGKSARVNLKSHPQARKFRTMLRVIAKKGANFAGHYALGYWRCGNQCFRIGIVDLKTGRTYLAPFYTGFGVSYRADSRLLIVEPPEVTKEYFSADYFPDHARPRYYSWNDNRLVLVYPKEVEEDFWK